MSDYDELRSAMTRRVHEYKALLEAQRPGSPLAGLYQARIDAVTTVLLRFERDLPRLRELDALIDEAERDLDLAWERLEAGAHPYPMLAAGLGGPGLALLLASLGLQLSSVVTMAALVLLAGAAGCVALTVRNRQRSRAAYRAARDYLDDLVDERDALLPPDLDQVVQVADSTYQVSA